MGGKLVKYGHERSNIRSARYHFWNKSYVNLNFRIYIKYEDWSAFKQFNKSSASS